MKNNSLTYGILILFLLSISSCVSKKKYNELGQYYENIEYDLKKSKAEVSDLKHQLALQKALGGEKKELPITTYKFDKLSHDFGYVAMGFEYTTKFKITNTGTEKLVRTSVKAGCSCTIPEYPKDPILPGKSAEITVKFTPGMPLGQQTKYVTVKANTKRKVAVISVVGNVRKN